MKCTQLHSYCTGVGTKSVADWVLTLLHIHRWDAKEIAWFWHFSYTKMCTSSEKWKGKVLVRRTCLRTLPKEVFIPSLTSKTQSLFENTCLACVCNKIASKITVFLLRLTNRIVMTAWYECSRNSDVYQFKTTWKIKQNCSQDKIIVQIQNIDNVKYKM